MSTLAETFSEHRRIAILRLLDETPGYRSNESLIHSFLDELGLGCSRDQVRTELAWLAEQGLVSVQRIATVDVATLTARGADVAGGRAVVPGVKRPSAVP